MIDRFNLYMVYFFVYYSETREISLRYSSEDILYMCNANIYNKQIQNM